MEYKLPKLPARPQNSNKGTFGKVLNIAGSKYMTGAAYLSSVAALRIGAGYVELISSEEVLRVVSNLAPEIVLAPLEKLSETINNSSVLSIGCGLSTSQSAFEIFTTAIDNVNNKPLVIDADGLNILSELDYKFNKNTIITPHPKEAARLLDVNLDNVLENVESSSKNLAKKYNCITVLKTHKTIVTDGKNIYKNSSGNSALAKAGSGDVLTGIISGLLAQKMKPFDAAVLGVYLHGIAGELAAKDLSEYGVLASDILSYIPFAIQNYLETTANL